ncbi:MAG: hypothetical protein EOO27_04755 [Comamonadaceae bacterium]|nr:MAG: hypothetical protein EOO27_04755 [Comamonadaceae bacterium]
MGLTVSVPDSLAYGSDEGRPATPHGQDVQLAAFNTVRNAAKRMEGGVDELARLVVINRNTLLHKTNPDMPTHHLSVDESIRLQKTTGDFSILRAEAALLGFNVIPAVPDQSGGDPVEAFMRYQAAQADLVSAVADGVLQGEGGFTPNMMRRVDGMAQHASAAIGHLVAMLRGRMRRAPEVRQ